jgi:serine/threonine protein kinase/Tfp pilus assembly protein PilF
MKCPKCETVNPDDSKYCKECAAPLTKIKDISFTVTLKAPAVGFSKGTVIAEKYKIIEKIGEGGMGVVYKAKDTRLDRTVALKFLSSKLIQDEEAKQRFVQEAKAAAALNHPNISIIHEIDEHQDQTFIVMEYIEGQSLKLRLKEGPLAVDKAKELAIQVAEGLKEAHAKGIVHRDIKPANIMLSEKGKTKITDFGLAKLSGAADLTKASTILGTVAYMSPEQAKGEAVDHRTDIWSLGAMLYEMLSGERPFKKSHEQALIYSIMNEEPEPLRSIRRDIPENMQLTVQKSLEKDLRQRFQNIEEFIQDLQMPLFLTPATAKNSIAVLSFADLSPEKDQEYFCDGMAEELINSLTKIKNLHVAARTSAFAFKGEKWDVREIGRRLNVETILEGSVRKSETRLRITAQLVNVRDGYHLWSDTFDRNMEDIFSIQEEISLAIVDKLKLKLLKNEKEKLIKRYTDDHEAYNLYLKGRFFWYRRYEGGLQKGIEFFQQAIAKDPRYALAYVGIADSFGSLGQFSFIPPKEAWPRAKAAAKKALEIDPELAEAYASLGWISMYYDWDWQAAEKEFKQAIKRNPDYALAHIWYGYCLAIAGRMNESIDEMKKAQEMDPLEPLINGSLGWSLYMARRFDEALAQNQKVIEMDPTFSVIYWYQAGNYLAKKMYDEALASVQKLIQLSGGAAYALSSLGVGYAFAGMRDEAAAVIERLNKLSEDLYISPLYLAWIYLGLDEKEKFFEYLEKAYQERTSLLVFLKVWPVFDSVRSDPRFKAILRKMKLL